jgi:hypothetical protein
MRRLNWRIVSGPGDFLPIAIGGLILFISLPTLVLLMLDPDPNSGLIGKPIIAILALAVVTGAGFVILGLQACTEPGSLVYRLAHGRLFWRRSSLR